MKYRILALMAVLATLTVTIVAEPFYTWDWVAPTAYENGNAIVGDTLTHTLYCGITEGGPYPNSMAFDQQSPPALQDMVFAVMGSPGTFYCVSTATSSLFGSESAPSNEANFIVTPSDQGFVPLPPILSLL